MHLFNLKENIHNIGYYERFVKENKEAILLLHSCIKNSFKKYHDFSELLFTKLDANPKSTYLIDTLTEFDHGYTIEEPLLKELERLDKEFGAGGLVKPKHPFFNTQSPTYKSDGFGVPIISFFGNIVLGDRSKVELFTDTHKLTKNIDDDNKRWTSIDIDNFVGVGPDFRDTNLWKEFIQSQSSKYDINKFHVLTVEFDTVLVRVIQDKKVDLDIMLKHIESIIFNKIIKYMLSFYTYKRYIAMHKDDFYSNHLDNCVKVAFIYKLMYNSINGVNEEDLGKSIDKLLNDFQLNLTYGSTKTAIAMTADMWRGKLIKGGYDIERFSDDMIKEVVDTFERMRHSFISVKNKNRISNPHFVKTGINDSYYVEGYNLKDSISNIYMEDMDIDNEPANSIIAMESIRETYGKTRIKFLSKLSNKERKIFVSLESDFMKIKTDALSIKTVDAQKIVVNALNGLGKIINIYQKDASEQFSELLTNLDTLRLELTDTVASRNIHKERNSMLYGQIATQKDWDF